MGSQAVTALLLAAILSLRARWAALTMSQSQVGSRLAIESLYANESTPQFGHEKLKVVDVFFPVALLRTLGSLNLILLSPASAMAVRTLSISIVPSAMYLMARSNFRDKAN